MCCYSAWSVLLVRVREISSSTQLETSALKVMCHQDIRELRGVHQSPLYRSTIKIAKECRHTAQRLNFSHAMSDLCTSLNKYASQTQGIPHFEHIPSSQGTRQQVGRQLQEKVTSSSLVQLYLWPAKDKEASIQLQEKKIMYAWSLGLGTRKNPCRAYSESKTQSKPPKHVIWTFRKEGMGSYNCLTGQFSSGNHTVSGHYHFSLTRVMWWLSCLNSNHHINVRDKARESPLL